MHITFSPMRRDTRPVYARQGDILLIEGAAFDFSGVANGDTLDADDVASDWVTGPVTREDGTLHLVLLLSHGADAPEDTRFPDPITVSSDGVIPQPPFDAEEAGE